MGIELSGKVCLITGADYGLGAGLVQGFLARGAQVAAGLRDAAAHAERVAPALALQMDVTDPDQVQGAIAATLAAYGRLDVLINNAGIFPRAEVETLPFEDWRRVMDVNLDGTWRCCQAAIPALKASQGCIINVGSITVKAHVADLVHYRTTKGAILALSRALALDLGPHGIRVNTVHPGAVKTEGEAAVDGDPEAVEREVNALQILPGRITPESIEPTFAFLASDDARDITGQSITVDRGWTVSD